MGNDFEEEEDIGAVISLAGTATEVVAVEADGAAGGMAAAIATAGWEWC